MLPTTICLPCVSCPCRRCLARSVVLPPCLFPLPSSCYGDRRMIGGGILPTLQAGLPLVPLALPTGTSQTYACVYLMPCPWTLPACMGSTHTLPVLPAALALLFILFCPQTPLPACLPCPYPLSLAFYCPCPATTLVLPVTWLVPLLPHYLDSMCSGSTTHLPPHTHPPFFPCPTTYHRYLTCLNPTFMQEIPHMPRDLPATLPSCSYYLPTFGTPDPLACLLLCPLAPPSCLTCQALPAPCGSFVAFTFLTPFIFPFTYTRRDLPSHLPHPLPCLVLTCFPHPTIPMFYGPVVIAVD